MTFNQVEAGVEQYEKFTSRVTKKEHFQYDYRDGKTGKLFSCIGKTLRECQDKRNAWLIENIAKSLR